jgi:hypothetical protein
MNISDETVNTALGAAYGLALILILIGVLMAFTNRPAKDEPLRGKLTQIGDYTCAVFYKAGNMATDCWPTDPLPPDPLQRPRVTKR